MQTKNRIWICHLILVEFVLVLANSCKKDGDNNNNNNRGIIFNPNLTYGTIIDIDENVYKTIKIGTQTWMAENLKTSHYSNGDLIGTTTPATLDVTAEATPKYQWAYDGNESNAATYGRLYTWFAVTDSRNICPTGWHVPTVEEWEILTEYLGGITVAGGKMKETGTTHWLIPNEGTNNETGFTALPGGERFYFGPFTFAGEFGSWWSSTEDSSAMASNRGMNYRDRDIFRYYNYKQSGFSVRCLMDK